MKKLILFLFFLFISLKLTAQEPFDVSCFDPPKISVKKMNFTTFRYGMKENNEDSLSNSSIPNAYYFNQGGVNVNLFGDNVFPSLNFKMVQYRLCIYENKEGAKTYIPFLIVSRMGVDNDSVNNNSVQSATGFEGSPLTFRVMESFRLNVGKSNNFSGGFICDLRGMMYKKDETRMTKYGGGVYLAAGLKYSGEGDVRAENNLQSYGGQWSFSALLNMFYTSDPLIRKNLFSEDTYNRVSNGAQFILKFSPFDVAAKMFSLYLSYQYLFGAIPKSQDKQILKLSIGVN